MKIIALVTVLAVLLLVFSGAMRNASVGGPLTIMLILFIAVVAVGVHDAWVKQRGALGWIVSIVVSVIGGILAASLGSMLTETLLSSLKFEGSLASTQHPLLYLSVAGMAMVTVLGSWLALHLVNRLR